MSTGDWEKISVRKILLKEIDKLLKDKLCLYSSRGDFVNDAVRHHIEKTRKDIMEERQHREHMEAME